MYPITEAPEHKTQLGDISITCLQQTRTVEKAGEMVNEFEKWLENQQPNTLNRRDFAKTHFGYASKKNVTEKGLTKFYPGTMQCVQGKERLFNEVKKVAREVTDSRDVKFDQVGF